MRGRAAAIDRVGTSTDTSSTKASGCREDEQLFLVDGGRPGVEVEAPPSASGLDIGYSSGMRVV